METCLGFCLLSSYFWDDACVVDDDPQAGFSGSVWCYA